MRGRSFMFLLLLAGAVAAATAVLLHGPSPEAGRAASHREAPLISLDPAADISDFFMFRSYEPGRDDRAVLVMNVNPLSEPSAGPNYWNFDPAVRYEFSVDNNRDGKEDVQFFVRFKTEFRGLTEQLKLPLSYVGGKTLPPIADLESQGIGLRQRYSVWMVEDGDRERIASGLIAVPSNVGPRTMPGYESLAAQGIYTLDNGMRVFAGQRQDPFYIDLGGIFDTLNLRRDPPVLTPAEDEADDANNFGTDMLSGFNVSTIALEVPIALLTADGKRPNTTAHPRIGAYAATTRPIISVDRHLTEPNQGEVRGRHAQIQRMANPLVNELVIPTEDKDRWGILDPDKEELFVEYFRNPRLALALELVVGVPAATSGREDLVDLLLRYNPGQKDLSELLRLNVATPPTPLAAQRRMGPLASTPDPAAWPNGRRPRDDVVDIAIRVVGGPNYIAARAGDGVNVDDAALTTAFPFLATPEDGRNRQHANPLP
jgi:uncharacterized protein DUF4331